MKGEKEVREVDKRKESEEKKQEENKKKGEIVAGSDAGEGGGGCPARRPQGLLGRGQPISLSLINSSRGDCNTAGDCWEKKDGGRGKRRSGRGENEIGMNGKVCRGGATELEDEEKIGKGGKVVVRMEREGGKGGKMGERKGGG